MVSGTCLQGIIHLNDSLLLGPNAVGQFQPLVVKSIHRKRMPVTEVRGGQTASFALKKVSVDFWDFDCRVLVECLLLLLADQALLYSQGNGDGLP